ncbi:membrane hypothetical protein [Candidatus Zixiibacteriota bacterium]|nr:membrane hypothetical protein [candidate division Zixibacteria bacterium]
MANGSASSKGLFWVLYLALIIAGILLLADALQINFLTRLSVRLGAGFIFSAIALIAGKDKPLPIISIALVWLAIIITILN